MTTLNRPHPLAVRDLRIYLGWHHTITPQELVTIAGQTLMAHMIKEGMPDYSLDEELGEYWYCRDLAHWMRSHKELNELYVEGKRIVNPSGRAAEDNERAG